MDLRHYFFYLFYGVKLAFDDIVSGLNLSTVKTANHSGRHLIIPLPTDGA